MVVVVVFTHSTNTTLTHHRVQHYIYTQHKHGTHPSTHGVTSSLPSMGQPTASSCNKLYTVKKARHHSLFTACNSTIKVNNSTHYVTVNLEYSLQQTLSIHSIQSPSLWFWHRIAQQTGSTLTICTNPGNAFTYNYSL